MSLTNGECVQRCLDGQPDAFRHLVRRYQGRLVSYLSGHLGGAEAAAEAAQETFVRAYFALRKLKKPDSFPAWLLGIAGRVARETLRERRRRAGTLRFDPPADRPERPLPRGALRGAVGELPDAYRQVVLLRYYGGLSCSDISAELRVPLGTVTKRLSRAYAMLRQALRDPPYEEGEVQP